jgi:hypothetical protein
MLDESVNKMFSLWNSNCSMFKSTVV